MIPKFSSHFFTAQFLAVLTLFATSILAPAQAQESVGKTQVDGHTVTLFANQTWRYDANSASGDCTQVTIDFSFCGDPKFWQYTQPVETDIVAQYRIDDRSYALFVHEGLGANDGMSLEFMKKAVIVNAAAAASVNPNEIIVLEARQVEIDGQAAEKQTYILSLDGLTLVFSNSILVTDNYSLQAITYVIGKNDTEQGAQLHTDFLAQIDLVD